MAAKKSIAQNLVTSLDGWQPTENITVVEMPLDVWNNIPTHPRQRNTGTHARAKHWSDAKNAKGAVRNNLRLVHAGWLDGQVNKVDGHTRTYLWANGQLPEPEGGTVTCVIHKVGNAEELNDLYMAFDNMSAAMSAQDEGFGALRENKLKLKSKRIQHGSFKTGVTLAVRGRVEPNQPNSLRSVDLYKAVPVFKKELIALDNLDLKREIFVRSILGAALLTVANDPSALEFWRRLNEGIAKRDPDGKKWDAVGNLLEFIKLNRGDQQMRNNQFHDHLYGVAIRAYEAWRDAQNSNGPKWFANRFRYTNPFPYIEAVRKARKLDYDDRLFLPESAVFPQGGARSPLSKTDDD